MRKFMNVFLVGCFAIAAIGNSAVMAGVVNLWGLADGDSIYMEQKSDAFFRMDLFDPPPRETQQRFHAISDPSVSFGSLAFDGFPHDANFRLGSATYDESGLIGGTGVAPITALALGVGFDPADSTYVNYGRWSPLNTIVDTFSGTATLVNGVVTSLDLTSQVQLNFTPIANVTIVAPGTFSVTGNHFAGHMETPSTGPNSQMIWDFSGTLTTVAVPEPSSFAMLSIAALSLGWVVRRRRA